MSTSILRWARALPTHMPAASRMPGEPESPPSPLVWAMASTGAAIIVLLGLKAAAPLPVLALAVLALAGGVFLVLLALGHVHLGPFPAGAGFAGAVIEAFDEGVLVTSPGKRILYCNASARALLGGAGAAGVSDSLDGLLAGEPAAAEALYRLRLAAGRSESRAEEFSIDLPAPGVGSPMLPARRLRVSVSPLATGAASQMLWRLQDVTAERDRERSTNDALRALLDLYDRLPVGVVIAEADGTVTAANALVRDELGYGSIIAGPGLSSTASLNLKDMLSADAIHLVAAQAQEHEAAATGLDLDIRDANQRLHPVRLLSRDVVAHAPAGEAGEAGDVAMLRIIAFTGHVQDTAAAGEGETAEARFSQLFQSAPFGIATLSSDGCILSANAAFARLSLNSTGGLQQPAVDVLVPLGEGETRAKVAAAVAAAIDRRANTAPIEIALGLRREYVRRLFLHPALRSDGTAVAAILYLVDATDEKALEAKFAQSQKMDAVGKLVGGIAHDFNNMLTAIIGYSDILLQTHRPTDPAHADIMSIRKSADRAAGFVSKLLTLSRQRTLNVEAILLDELVTDLAPLLNRSIGETIDLRIHNGRDLWHVRTDKGEIEQAVLNLAVNARDAMSGNGRLTLRTRNITERETRKLALEGMVQGEYVALEVEDSGTGMTPEILAHIFEPFFTTKAIGKGTGLGLAAVMGMVKQSGGYIYADSTPGRGTTFRIYLPRYHVEAEEEEAAAAVKAQRARDRQPADITGTGRVLLVEDEDVVRAFAVRALKSRGYEVLEASDGREALEVMEKAGGQVDIVVSDVVMPEMDGPSLMKALRAKNPDIKIIFVSGYPNEAFKASLDDGQEFAFLAKPFSLPQLAAKVKEELGR